MNFLATVVVAALCFLVVNCEQQESQERELIGGFLRKVEQKAKGVESKVTSWVREKFGAKVPTTCPVAAAAAAKKDSPLRKSISDWSKKLDEYKNARDKWLKNPRDVKSKAAHDKARDAYDKASEDHHKTAKAWEGSTHEWCASTNYCAIGPAVPAPAPIPSTPTATGDD